MNRLRSIKENFSFSFWVTLFTIFRVFVMAFNRVYHRQELKRIDEQGSNSIAKNFKHKINKIVYKRIHFGIHEC